MAKTKADPKSEFIDAEISEVDGSVVLEPSEHELIMPGDEKKMPMRQPVSMHQTHASMLYVRIHRREGEDRLLDNKELAGWVERLEEFVDELKFDAASPPEFHVCILAVLSLPAYLDVVIADPFYVEYELGGPVCTKRQEIDSTNQGVSHARAQGGDFRLGRNHQA